MGLRTMVSPNRGQAPHFPPLARQGSLYNLTLDEVQSQSEGNLGKPLNSMNLNELLMSVIPVEGNQVKQNSQTSGVHASSPSSSTFLPSNCSLNHNVSVDGSLQRQPTLAETTLKDFLVCTGAINMENRDVVGSSQPLIGIDPMVVVSQQADWMQFQMKTAQQQQQMSVMGSNFPISGSVFGNLVGDVGYSENQLALSMPMPIAAASSSDSQTAVERKRRFSDEMMEKTIERRQKRMIKNRESAARSRARKQAYTNQLEQAVSELGKTNNRLKKQKEREMLLLSMDPPSAPKYQLRRTNSTPF